MISAPQNSVVRKLCGQIPAWILRSPVIPARWSAELQKLEGHIGVVTAVAFSQDGSLLASGLHDETVRLWNPATGQEVHKSNNVSRIRTTSLTVDSILTNPAAILINDDSVSSPVPESFTRKTSFVKDNWIQQNHRNFLWLPQEYRSHCSAFHGSTIAIGRKSGQVSFIQIDHTEMTSL